MLKWLNFSGVVKEAKRIRWPNTKELMTSCAEVVLFCILFGVFFVASESLIVYILKILGIGA